MATYDELAQLTSDNGWQPFRNKVAVAVGIKATAIIDSATPTTTQLEWAQSAISGPRKAGDDIVWYVISSNAGATVSQILSASDNAIQTNVDAAVDVLYP